MSTIAFSDRLASAERRAGWRAWVDAVAAGACAGLAALLLVAVLRLLPEDMLGALAPLRDAAWPLFLPLAPALAAFAVLALYWNARLPGTLALAQAADRRFGFKETVSTVTELDRRGRQPDSAVLSALYRAAETDGARIDPAALVPIRLPRLALAIPVLLVLALAALSVTPAARVAEAERAASAAAGSMAVLQQEEREIYAEALTRVAEVINRQLETAGDPYMEAVARTLAAMNERLRNDRELTREELAEALEALAAHTQAATGTVPRALRDQITAVLDTMARDLRDAAEVPETTSSEAAGDPGEMSERDTPDLVEAAQRQRREEAQGETPNEPDLFDQIYGMEETQQTLQQGGNAEDEAAETATTGNYYNIAEERNVAAAEAAADRGEDAQVIGGAETPDAGGNEVAGLGTDVIGLEGEDFEGIAFETVDELFLAANPTEEGRRFQMSVPPATEFTAVDRGVVLPEGTGWAYTPESTPQRDGVGLINRDAVSAYLRALANRETTSEVAP